MIHKPPARLTDEQILAGLKRRPYDRIAREAARRLEELLRERTR